MFSSLHELLSDALGTSFPKSADPKGRAPETWFQPSPDDFPSSWLAGVDPSAEDSPELVAMFAKDQKDRTPGRGKSRASFVLLSSCML